MFILNFSRHIPNYRSTLEKFVKNRNFFFLSKKRRRKIGIILLEVVADTLSCHSFQIHFFFTWLLSSSSLAILFGCNGGVWLKTWLAKSVMNDRTPANKCFQFLVSNLIRKSFCFVLFSESSKIVQGNAKWRLNEMEIFKSRYLVGKFSLNFYNKTTTNHSFSSLRKLFKKKF